jgi:cation transport regulator
MPRQQTNELPVSVREYLPAHAQEIFLAAYNSAWDEYVQSDNHRGGESREDAAFKVAWAAVKREYKKDERTGQRRPTAGPESAGHGARTSH